jgi:hypothetical protein
MSHAFKVVAGVVMGLGVAALPLLNKTVRAREEAVAEMRDASYTQKDVARDARMRRGTG